MSRRLARGQEAAILLVTEEQRKRQTVTKVQVMMTGDKARDCLANALLGLEDARRAPTAAALWNAQDEIFQWCDRAIMADDSDQQTGDCVARIRQQARITTL